MTDETTARDRAIEVVDAAWAASFDEPWDHQTNTLSQFVVDALLARPEVLRALAGAPTADVTAERPTIVTICGSMRFFEQMLQVAADETAKGNIVLAPFSVVAPEDQGSEFKAMLDKLHFEKIDMSERIIVVTSQDGYVGTSTRREMGYALNSGKAMDVREFHLPAAPEGVDAADERERLREELGLEAGMRTGAVDELESLRRELWQLINADQLSDQDTLSQLRYQCSLVRHWHDRYEQLRARDEAAKVVVQWWREIGSGTPTEKRLRERLNALARAHKDERADR